MDQPSSVVCSTECPEEQQAQSSASQGRISDVERVGRLAHRRDHISACGELSPAGMPVTDLRDSKRKGVSVFRIDGGLDPPQRERLHGRFRDRSSTVNMRFFVASVGEVRSIRSVDGRRVFCVVDDATDAYDAHALIRLDYPDELTEGQVRGFRNELLRLFRSSEPLIIAMDRMPPNG